ncbi:MAG: hypothetical protein FJ225_01830 [Lentisphaerae bacterium]|nr:hypothetical protein [Lentisphaerota bacterium]
MFDIFVGFQPPLAHLETWNPEDYPEQTARGVVLDVRTPQEYELWHIPGAVNIPLGRLRRSLEKLDRERPVFVYCKVGFRSYLAYRVLRQKGFRAASLSGGTMTFCAWHGAGVCPAEPEPPVVSYAEDRQAPRPSPAAGDHVLHLLGPERVAPDRAAGSGQGLS